MTGDEWLHRDVEVGAGLVALLIACLILADLRDRLGEPT